MLGTQGCFGLRRRYHLKYSCWRPVSFDIVAFWARAYIIFTHENLILTAPKPTRLSAKAACVCKMKRLIGLALGAFLGCQAHAATFGLHLGGMHFPSASYQNNINPGMYVRTDDGLTLGAYYNTLRRVSIYAGYTYEFGPFGLMGGVITGYKPKMIDGVSYGQGKTLTPIAALSLRLPQLYGFAPMLMLVPPFESSPAVFHLAFEHRF